jgi:hypothetical protein
MVAKVELDSCGGCKAGVFAAVSNWVFPDLISKVMVFHDCLRYKSIHMLSPCLPDLALLLGIGW